MVRLPPFYRRAPQPPVQHRYAQNDERIAARHIERPEQGQERARDGQTAVEQRDRAMTIPGNDQSLVEMGAVGGEDVFAIAQAAEEGERGVEDERPDQQHAGQGQPGIVLRGDDGEDGKGVAQEGAADVAHEDAGRRPVVTQEAQTGGGQQ